MSRQGWLSTAQNAGRQGKAPRGTDSLRPAGYGRLCARSIN